MSRALRLGIFIVAGLTVFGLVIFIIGGNQMLFKPTLRLNANFKNAAGLAGGADVRVAGIREGTVKRIDLPRQPDQLVRVEMAMDNSVRNVIKKDSSTSIRTQGLMGDEYVEILPGSKDSATVKDGDTLEGQTPLEISDLIKKANGILDSADGALKNVDATTGNLNSITSKVDKGAGTIGALVNNQKVYDNVAQASEEMKEDMEAVKHNFLLSHFFHKRGYEDAADLTKNEIRSIPPVESATKVFNLDANKIFDKPDTAKVKQEKLMKEAGAWLQNSTFGLAVIAAATDKGDSEKDRTLTEARAMVVRNYLVNNFKLDDTKVKTIGLGKSTMLPSGIAVLVYPPGVQIGKPPASKR